MKRLLIILTIFLLILSLKVKAQNIDSLIAQAANEPIKYKKIILLNELLKIAQQNKDTAHILTLYNKLYEVSNVYRKYYFLQKKITILEDILKKDPKNSISIYKNLYYTYEQLAIVSEQIIQLEPAEYYYKKMLKISKLLKDDSLKFNAYKKMGALYYFRHQFDSALIYIYKSIALSKLLNIKRDEILLKNLLAQIYLYKNNYDSTILYTLNNVRDAYRLNDTILLSFSYLITAKVYYKLNLLDSAERILNKSIFLFHQKYANVKIENLDIFYKHLYISQNILFAKILYKRKQYSNVVFILKNIMDKLDSQQNTYIYILENLYIGMAYAKLNKLDLAQKHLSIANNLINRFNCTFYTPLLNYALGIFYITKQMDKQAEFYFIKAVQAEKQSSFYNNLLIDIYKELANLYEKQGNYKQAIIYYKKEHKIRDSIYTLRTLQNIFQRSFSLQLQNIEYNYSKILQLKQKYNTILIIFLLILFILFVHIYILLIRYRKQNKILNLHKEKIERQQEFIKKQNEYFRLLSLVATHTQNSIFILDTAWNFIWVNPAFEKLYQIDFESFKQQYTNFFSATRYENPNLIYKRCVLERKSFIYHNKHIINQRVIWIQTTVSPIIEDNQVVNIIGIESDITKLKIAEERITQQKKELENKNSLLELYNKELLIKQKEIVRQNEELRQQQEELKVHAEQLDRLNKELELLSIVATYTDNSVIIFNTNGDILWVNKAFEKNTGYTLNEYIEKFGKNIMEASSFRDIEDYFYKVLNERISVKYISKFQTRYGKTIWVQTNLTPIIDRENYEVVKYIVAIDSDITAVKEAEERIQQQNKEIVSSIEYANRILKAMTPLPIFLNVIYKDYFILNLPKYIVSGDFYFVSHQDKKIITALADCTGHGIPGAFMSIIGNMAFYTVMSRLKDIKADIILSELKNVITRLLHQRGKTGEIFDSMDVGLTIFDTETNTLEYAGANIPLYIVRKDEKTNEIIVKRIKPNKTTIGFTDLDYEQPFNVHKIKLSETDYIYISSDGYTDQIGGPNRKRFKRRRFIDILQKVYGMPMPKQREIFLNTLEEWKGACEQIDDILVLGIKFF